MEYREYTVMVSDLPHTFLLTAEQAKERGIADAPESVEPVEQKAAEKPRNKSKKPQANKAAANVESASDPGASE